MEKQQEKKREFIERRKVKEKEKILGESKRFLRVAGIAERREQVICLGIVEGGTPCFVYRRKAEDLDPRAPSFSIIILIDIVVN